MQFTALTLFALVAAVVANPIVPRQQASEANEVTVEAPAMTDKNGNVIPFDSETVSQPNLEAVSALLAPSQPHAARAEKTLMKREGVTEQPFYWPHPSTTKFCTLYLNYDFQEIGCDMFISAWDISLEQFFQWNPAAKDCVKNGLERGISYCIEEDRDKPAKEVVPMALSEVKDHRKSFSPGNQIRPLFSVLIFLLATAVS